MRSCRIKRHYLSPPANPMRRICSLPPPSFAYCRRLVQDTEKPPMALPEPITGGRCETEKRSRSVPDAFTPAVAVL